MRRLGILGGTFDPPHIGHLVLGEYAAEALDFEKVLFVPAADPPHKTDVHKSPVEHRLAMLQIALADNPRFRISRVDLDRPGPHYSLDTVQIIQQQCPDAELYFVMGGDSLRDLPKWHAPEKLVQQCRLAVMERPGAEAYPTMHDAILPGLAERVVMIDAPVLEIASSEIVPRLKQGRSARYIVPDGVLHYIHQHGLYRKNL